MSDRTAEREKRIRWVLDRRQPTLAVVMENIHDPHNVSAILRTCDAVGVCQVHLLYNAEPFPNFRRQGKKSSAGARKWIETPRHHTVEDCYRSLREQGFRIYAACLADESKPLFDLDFTQPTAIVFGNEHRGVSEEGRDQADGAFLIPMMGMVQSLNVSVAAAVTLYEGMRQRFASGFYDQPQLVPEAYERHLSEWLRK